MIQRLLRTTGALLFLFRDRMCRDLLIGTTLGLTSWIFLIMRIGFLGINQGTISSMSSVSMGDAVLWPFVGNPIGPDVAWCGVCTVLLMCSSLANKPIDPLRLIGAGSRTLYWTALYAAAAVKTSLLLFCFGAGLVVPSLTIGCSFEVAARSIGELSLGCVASTADERAVVGVLIVLFLGFVTLSEVGLLACLLSKEVFALAFVVALTLGSAFAPALPSPGSWLIVSRLRPFALQGVTAVHSQPLWLAAAGFMVLATIAYVCGKRRLQRCDIGLRGGLA